MNRLTPTTRRAGLALTTALAATLLAGCTTPGQVASRAADRASTASGAAASDADIARAEARVASAPRNAETRLQLADAYLSAGRFASAATTYEDARALGRSDARSGLRLALAYIGSGRAADAIAVLSQWQAQIPAADLGLALALAGQPGQGVGILTDVVRGGDDSARTRQNLAYAYALAGRWAEARVIAAQDVPADQVDVRLRTWAAGNGPDQYRARIAGLLGTPLGMDPGQPAALALDAPQGGAQMAQDSAGPQAAPVMQLAQDELPALEAGEASAARAEAAMASAMTPAPTPAPTAAILPRIAAAPAAAPVPVAAPAAVAPAPRFTPARFAARTPRPVAQDSAPAAAPLQRKDGSHLVQLGSFRTLEGARRAWGIFVARDARLKNHAMRITEARVNGQQYFRVAAEGFDGNSAQAMCATIRQRGAGCLAYAREASLPGAVPTGQGAGKHLASR